LRSFPLGKNIINYQTQDQQKRANKVAEKKKKIGFWTKFTTEDWMTPKQLKAFGAFNVAVEAILIYVVFIIARPLFGVASSVALCIVLFLLVASIIVYRIEKKLRLKTRIGQ
jgi:predicted phage tail protein